jgi:hypothetical protein
LPAIARLAAGSRDIGAFRPDSIFGKPHVQDITAAIETMNRSPVVHHSKGIGSAKNLHALPRPARWRTTAPAQTRIAPAAVALSVRPVQVAILVPFSGVVQDEATKAESKSGLPMFGEAFPQ